MSKTKVSKGAESTELALHGATSIAPALELLMKKKNALQEIHETKYLVSKGEVTLGNGARISIQDEKDPANLQLAYASVRARILQLKEANEALMAAGATVPVTVKVDGGTLEEWTSDVVLRMKKLQTEEKYALITKKTEELKALMSNADRMEILKKEIENI